MRHRHLDAGTPRWSVAAIDSILERGGARDVIALLAELRRDPLGPAADAALRAAEHSGVYGYPALVRTCIERWRRGQPARG